MNTRENIALLEESYKVISESESSFYELLMIVNTALEEDVECQKHVKAGASSLRKLNKLKKVLKEYLCK